MADKLGQALIKIGAPVLKGILAGVAPGAVSKVGGLVIDGLADALGSPADPDAIADKIDANPAAAAVAVAPLEAEMLSLQIAGRDRRLSAEDAKGWFAWAWRPAMSWLIIFLTGWALILVPLLNAALKAAIAAPTMQEITAFAGLWLVIYGGGHTAKSIWGK